jgi:hypothetical protein
MTNESGPRGFGVGEGDGVGVGLGVGVGVGVGVGAGLFVTGADGVTAAVAVLATEFPTALTARIVKVTEAPFDRPLTEQDKVVVVQD